MTSADSSSGSLPSTPSSTRERACLSDRALGDREVAQVEDGADLGLRGEPLVRWVSRSAAPSWPPTTRSGPPVGASDTHQPPASTRCAMCSATASSRVRVSAPDRSSSRPSPDSRVSGDPRRDPAAAPAAVVAGRVDVLSGRHLAGHHRPAQPGPLGAVLGGVGQPEQPDRRVDVPGEGVGGSDAAGDPGAHRAAVDEAAHLLGDRDGVRARTPRSRRCRTRPRRSGPPGCRAPARWPG